MHSILNARTDFSIGESILQPTVLVARAKELGETVVGVTDTMSVTSLIAISSAAKKEGLKPVVGCRLRMVDDITWRKSKEIKKEKEYFPAIYARTERGLQAIYRLLTIANQEGHFHYKPRLEWNDLVIVLATLNSDDVYITTGDAFSLLAHPRFAEILTLITAHLPTSSIFATLVAVEAPYWDSLNQLAVEACVTHGVQPLLVRPCLYPTNFDAAAEVMGAICNNNRLADGWHKSPFSRDLHPMSGKEIAKIGIGSAARLAERGVAGAGPIMRQAIVNTEVFAAGISYVWEKSKPSLPVMASDEYAELVVQCKKGWPERFSRVVFGHQPTPAELSTVYMDRLKYELSVIKKLGFSGYFLLVQDIVQFAKKSGILVGPGRGSVGGSLIAYLMGITECDPIRFNLLFERFINPDRLDLPDADLDFMSERRHEIVEYLVKKYGETRVAGVSNFGSLAAASTMRDVSKAIGIPESEYRVSKFIPAKHGVTVKLEEAAEAVGEIAAFRDRRPEVWGIMSQLEGSMRNMSQHAAGIVVAGCDIVERGVVEKRKDSYVCNWDKRVIEDQGLIKVDILGLSNLDIMNLALNYIRERHGVTVDISAIPLDDEKILENFALARVTGIFQFDGSGGMRKLLRELGSTTGTVTFEDITAATALYRPGPMEAGLMEAYYKRKQGLESIEYDHPLLEPVLSTTFGVFVYQEQIMQTSVVIAGYSGPDADKLRKIMGKKLPAEMAKERGKFVAGCVATIGCLDTWAGLLFDKIEGFAGYGFNRSHSVEYTLISYQMMYLKVYYPVEFFAAALSLMSEEKLPALLVEGARMGIDIDVPDINNSTSRFEIVTDTRLVMPFGRVKGLTSRTADAIVLARESLPAKRFADKAEFVATVNKTIVNKSKQEILDKIGAFARIEPTQPSSVDPVRLRDQIDLLPGLISAAVPIDRDLDRSKVIEIAMIVRAYRDAYGPAAGEDVDGMPVKPHFGKRASIFVITDAPTNGEEMAATFAYQQRDSRSAPKPVEAISIALDAIGLELADIYLTGLIKRPKAGKQVDPEETGMYAPYLMQEIEALKPPVILLCGSQTVRHFLPDFKGKASDAAGKIIYSKALDANLVIGFNVGEIFYAPEKQEDLARAFAAAADLVRIA